MQKLYKIGLGYGSKTGRLAMACTLVLMVSLSAQARDTRVMYSIDEAMSTADAQNHLDDQVSFYFGETSHPAVAKKFGNFQSNKKTNGVGKKDEVACQRAFLNALFSFKKRALAEGGNAVVNIQSYYKKNTVSSTSEFECGSGAIMSGVTLTGDVVKI